MGSLRNATIAGAVAAIAAASPASVMGEDSATLWTGPLTFMGEETDGPIKTCGQLQLDYSKSPENADSPYSWQVILDENCPGLRAAVFGDVAPPTPTPTPPPQPTPTPPVTVNGCGPAGDPLWWLTAGDYTPVPNRPPEPINVEYWQSPRFVTERGGRKEFCARLDPIPGRTITKLEFDTGERHQNDSCAGVLLTVTALDGPNKGKTYYSSNDPNGVHFNRYARVILRDEDAVGATFKVVVDDKSPYIDMNGDGRIDEQGAQIPNGDLCTAFDSKALIYYERDR